MNDTSAPSPIDRVTARFEPDPPAALRCSHCSSVISDDDANCPTCESPIDWGASMSALRAWQQRSGGDAASG
jgi:hypothetical protein